MMSNFMVQTSAIGDLAIPLSALSQNAIQTEKLATCDIDIDALMRVAREKGK